MTKHERAVVKAAVKATIDACSLVAYKKSVPYGSDPYVLGYARGREDAGLAVSILRPIDVCAALKRARGKATCKPAK